MYNIEQESKIMAEEKDTTKSGIQGPASYNGRPPASIEAPTKIYPGSYDLAKGASKDGGMIVGPASGKNTDKAGA